MKNRLILALALFLFSSEIHAQFSWTVADDHTFAAETIYDNDCISQKVSTNTVTTIKTCGKAITGVDVQYDDACKATVTWDAVAKGRTKALFDNAIMVTHPGAGPGGTDYSTLNAGEVVLATSFDYTSNCWIADDFILDTDSEITEMEFYGVQQGSNTGSIFTGVFIQIYDGPPNAGGTVIFGDKTTNRMVSSEFSGIYRTNISHSMVFPIMKIVADMSVSLPAGTYWVCVSTLGANLPIPYTFANPVTELDVFAHGNALLDQSAGWEAWRDNSGIYGTGAPLGLPFTVYGDGGDPPNPKYNVYMDDELVASEIETTTYTHTTAVAQGVDVEWCVTQVYPNGDESEAGCKTAKCGDIPPCDPITNGKAEINCTTAVLTWTAVTEAKEYEVTRDGNTVKVTEPTHTETGTFEDKKSYTWMVKTICEDGESAEVAVTGVADCVGINELANNVAIYPNPTNGQLRITTSDMRLSDIRIYDIVGKLVGQSEIGQSEIEINISHLPTGIYFFKVYDSNNNSVTKRIMVTK